MQRNTVPCLPGGSLEVAWAIEQRSTIHLVIEWRSGWALVSLSEGHGFEREVDHSLGGEVRIGFETEGWHVNLKIPLDSEGDRRSSLVNLDVRLDGMRVLIVEDEAMIASLIEGT